MKFVILGVNKGKSLTVDSHLIVIQINIRLKPTYIKTDKKFSIM
jgi:hypothetical protein